MVLFLRHPSHIYSFWIAFLFSLMVTLTGGAADLITSDDQMKQIEIDLTRQKEQYRRFDSQEKGLLEQLTGIDTIIIEKRRLIKELRQRINETEKELNENKKRLIAIEHSIQQLESLVRKRLVALYKYAKRGYLQTLASADDLDQLNKRMKYLEAIVNDDHRVMKQLADERTMFRSETTKIEDQLATIAKMEEVESNRLGSVKKDLEKKVILLARIHQEKEFYQTAVKELEYAARNLKETLLNLDKNIQTKIPLPNGFEKLKGKLPLPYQGKILKDIKKLGTETANTQKGIYISGALGEEVKAVFPGRVDFSGQLKGYGEVIVINHGDRFFTISAYLLQRDKEEGETVSEGEVIGQLGQTALLTGPGLYFEIRKGGVPLDPLDWLEVH